VGSIEWTIGEPVSESYFSTSHITTMGFHQPDIDMATLLNEMDLKGSLYVYPNPVGGLLNISVRGMEAGIYNLKIIDAAGRIVFISEAEVNQHVMDHQLSLNEMAMGNYLLTISNTKFSTTIKLTKTN
jgi:hypothetical protein